MAAHHLAQGLASLGRNGDSMLMHVTPNEVAGLKNLAKSMGGEITINPHTGLPEAGFFDFLGDILPTAVDLMLAAPTGGGSLAAVPGAAATTAATTAATAAPGLFASMQAAPILGGMATGSLVAGARGEDMLTGGVMGALSGLGAPGLNDAFTNMGKGIGTAASTAGGAPVANIMDKAGAATAIDAPMLSQQIGGANLASAPSGLSGLLSNAGSNLSNAGSAIGSFMKNPIDAYKQFTNAGGSGMQLATTLGYPAYKQMQPDPIDMSEEEARREALRNKYKSSTGGLNLSASSGLNLGLPSLSLASGGAISGAGNYYGSQTSSGGNQDLYGSSDNAAAATELSKDGYGIGRLDKLAQQGSLTKAGDMFYAQGGPVSFAEGGTSLNVNTGKQGGGSLAALNGPGGFGVLGKLVGGPKGMAALNGPGGFGVLGKLLGGPEGIAALNAPGGMGLLLKKISQALNPPAPVDTTPTTIDPFNPPGMYPQAENNYMASVPTAEGTYALKAAKGGYLDGQGDGMSDSIPATIEGKQPARLADGEFVVPADVVSHLGNGSSKAGSKRLYAMLDKVRHARTGNKKQGKEINPNKYMPA